MKVQFTFTHGEVLSREAFVGWYQTEGREVLAKLPTVQAVIDCKLNDPGWKEVHCQETQKVSQHRTPQYSWNLVFI